MHRVYISTIPCGEKCDFDTLAGLQLNEQDISKVRCRETLANNFSSGVGPEESRPTSEFTKTHQTIINCIHLHEESERFSGEAGSDCETEMRGRW